jgi:CRP-like cAMP-binding protein
MFIEKSNLFRALKPEAVEAIAKSLVEESRETGQFLFRHGEPAEYLYILVEGRVRLSIGDMGHMTLVVSNPGDAFGWSSLVQPDHYTASAECLVPCKVSKIGRERLADIFDKDPVSGLQFYKRLVELVAQRLEDIYRSIPAAHGEKRAAPGG